MRRGHARAALVRAVIIVECLLSGLLGLHVGLDYLPRLLVLGKWNVGYEVVYALLGQGRATDLLQDYGGARALLFGGNAYEPTGALARRYVQWGTTYLSYVSTHPPTAFALLLPLAALPFGFASAIWAVLMLCGLAFCVRTSGAPWHVASFLAPALILLPPVATGVEQLAVALLTLVFLAYRFRHRPFVAGLIIGAASLIKYVPAVLLVPCVVRRQWSAVAGFAVVWIGVLGLIAALNVDALRAYIALAGSTTATWIAEPSNGAFLFAPWLLHYGPLGVALPLAVVVWVMWIDVHDLRRGESDDRGRWARWTWLSVALLPIAWTFSVLPLALPLMILVQRRRIIPLVVALAGVVLLLVPFNVPAGLPPFIAIACMGVALGLDGLKWRPLIATTTTTNQDQREALTPGAATSTTA